jgi:hypothetical protein
MPVLPVTVSQVIAIAGMLGRLCRLSRALGLLWARAPLGSDDRFGQIVVQ